MASVLGRRLSVVDSAYIVARLLVAVALLVMYATGSLKLSSNPAVLAQFRVGLAVFTVTGAVILFGYLVLRLTTRQVLLWALPLDLVTGGLLLIGTHSYPDPMYTWLVGIVIVYAVALPRREGSVVAVLTAASYLVAHYIGYAETHTAGDWVFLTFKGVSLMLVGYFVASGTQKQTEREAELAASHEDIETLNDQLQRRLAELNAVSEITEVVHSSLDFDAIGPLVLEIIQKVIDVPACSLLVLDKEKAETLFSASSGLGKVPPGAATTLGAMVQGGQSLVPLEGGLFSCLTILDHGQMMVVFCASAEHIEAMRLEDRLVLQAVASELAVAVENSQLYKLTKRLSITDELTGLHNYRHLHQRLEDEFERARRFGRSLSLLMLDADDFKKYNDLYGHVAGDRALTEIGALIKTSVREIDVPARYGGEEFSVVLPETDAAGAFVVAEKIRETICAHRFADGAGDRNVQLTVSIGLATYPMHAEDREALLRQADEALYQAKHMGRDRVRAAKAADLVDSRPRSTTETPSELSAAEELPA